MVERCHTFAVWIHRTYQNFSFSMIRLTIYDQHRSPQTLLFYSKHNVWILPEILSPFPAPYDKNSFLWLLANFSKKWDFGRISCIWMNLENPISSKSLRGATEASFCRTELERGSKFQERSILYVLNKIKVFVYYCDEETGFLILFDGFLANNKYPGAILIDKNHDFF